MGLFTVQDLRGIPAFCSLSDESLEALLERHRCVEVEAAQTLVLEQDWGDNLMVILSGLAKVRSFTADGEEAVLSLVGAGELLGELAVLDGDPRSADVVTLSTVQLLKLQGTAFKKVLETSVQLSLSIARLEASRLRDLNGRFAIQQSDATTRVLNAIAYLAQKSNGTDDPLSVIPPIPKGEIALIAGLARESSSRTLSKLRDRGIVIEEDGCLRLASLDPLKKRGLIA